MISNNIYSYINTHSYNSKCKNKGGCHRKCCFFTLYNEYNNFLYKVCAAYLASLTII